MQLAIKMTNCLNTQMGKTIIAQCEEIKNCKIQGDDWYAFYNSKGTLSHLFSPISIIFVIFIGICFIMKGPNPWLMS